MSVNMTTRVVPNIFEWSYLPIEAAGGNCEYIFGVAQHYWVYPLSACAIYLVVIFGIKAYMADKEPFDLKVYLRYWNLFLAVFSIIGFTRVAPEFFNTLAVHGFNHTLCTDPCESYGLGAQGIWVLIFAVSKFPELIDTLFIVLRKKPLIFLHWYHHITVLCYVWHCWATGAGNASWFAVMNYFVHSVMYFYYYLAACGKPPRWGYLITQLQIAQMIMGSIVIGMTYYRVYLTDEACYHVKDNMMWGGLMYGSYLFLFVRFYVQVMLKRGKKSAEAKSKKKQ